MRIVESGDVRNGWLDLAGLREIEVVQNVRTERHLLRPFDVLVTARAGHVQTALVPPGVSRTMAGITLLVARPNKPETGMGHWLWYFLGSSLGQKQLAKRLTVSATIRSLSARGLSEIEVPAPADRQLELMARLIEASEIAYDSAIKAAQLRHWQLRDSLIQEIAGKLHAAQ